jgi:hypothetical protein
MGFLSQQVHPPKTKGPQNMDETFYGTSLAGRDISAFEMREEEVCSRLFHAPLHVLNLC